MAKIVSPWKKFVAFRVFPYFSVVEHAGSSEAQRVVKCDWSTSVEKTNRRRTAVGITWVGFRIITRHTTLVLCYRRLCSQELFVRKKRWRSSFCYWHLLVLPCATQQYTSKKSLQVCTCFLCVYFVDICQCICAGVPVVGGVTVSVNKSTFTHCMQVSDQMKESQV